MKVKFLEEKMIEAEAMLLLKAYEQQFDMRIAPPVPIEEIAECNLELDLRLGNLEVRLRRKGVLGAIWMDEKKVVIDESLDPTTHPSQNGRYRFTLGHEVGHWVLHRAYYFARSLQHDLFAADEEPSIVCRNGDTAPIEWQANAFSACALMPKELVQEAWEQRQGTLRPYDATDEVSFLSSKWSLGEDEVPTVQIAREMAKQQFHVSAQAMQIRLTGLGLIQLYKENPILFDEWK
jgi:IrrE N-terminal-like domain